MAPPHVSNTTYHLLPLRDDGSPDLDSGPSETPYIYLDPPTSPAYSIRFEIPGSASVCHEGSLWCNIPAKGETFERSKFKEYKLTPSFNSAINIDIPVYNAGAFSYYLTHTPIPPFAIRDAKNVSPPKPEKTREYYIDVEPRLRVQKTNVPLDAISVISVLSKFMGKYPSDWDRHLHGISERGYNMVHYTPLMTRGISNSPYSLYDQLTFDKEVFPNGEKDVADLVKRMDEDFGLMALTDVVWNHSANNSKWLEEHPDAGYNIKTAPHLESAYLLDTELLKYSESLASRGLPTKLTSTDDLQKIMDVAKKEIIPALNLWQFYVCNVERDTKAAVEAWTSGKVERPEGASIDDAESWSLKQKADWLREHAFSGTDRMGERYRRQIQPERAAALLEVLFGKSSGQTADQRSAHGAFLRFLNEVNLEWYREYDADVEAIIDQVFNRAKYTRLEDHGPKIGEINEKNPLIETYFTRLPENDTTKKHDPGCLALANNGWVWAADVMRDNAGPESKVYLRRELIVWADCVKLRYGKGPEDSPFLWKFMKDYTQLMAKYFTGFRIDNCHSTPLHVAEYMLDAARQVRPNLVVAAELFSGDEKMDYLYCQRLGISALIREAMQVWSTAELSRLVHINCGRPVGSFEVDDITGADVKPNGSLTNGLTSPPAGREIVKRVLPSKLHALLMDCTHDNETPVQRRDGRDTLPTSALVAMCASASGSVFGMDELYPQLIELVHETRPYTSPYSEIGLDKKIKIGSSHNTGLDGIGSIKKLMNQLHTIMGMDGYDESHVHHDGEYITVHRLHPRSRKGYYLVAHTAFPGYGNGNAGFSSQTLTGTKARLLGAWSLECDQSEESKKEAREANVLKGVPAQTKDLKGIRVETRGDDTIVSVPDRFPPGSIAVFETWIPAAEHSEGLDKFVTSGAREAFSDCSLIDLNALLYRADAEEQAASGGENGSYTIDGIGTLVYCGLQGWWSVLRDVIARNDLGHPICNHLRAGQWALDYIVGRLEKLSSQQGYTGLEAPAEWLRARFDAIRRLPSFLLPRYFALVVRTAYKAAYARGLEQMNSNVRDGQEFMQALAMVSVQCQGYMPNASLWPQKLVPSLAAGLPHFAQDWARCWGRDIMIAMRGLLLCTGRPEDAREHLLCFASVVKHGMVPNLLGSGKIPRYNSRDSVWFFLQNIQDYCNLVPNGDKILQEKVKRRFQPYDDEWFPWDDAKAYATESTVAEVVHECLQRHAEGMHFREYNAGPAIDSQMKSEGFNIDIETDWEDTGMIFGGNEWNCGTWMDKMGESEKAGNKGHPGTSRDGAPVEITGMLYSTLRWVDSLQSAGKISTSSVKTKEGKEIPYKTWADKIKASFERCYYVPADASEDKSYDVNPSIINRRGIYKDVYRGIKEFRDYQLRANFPIAMCVAPDLFDPEHALLALEQADINLLGPTGMATLDPGDYEYNPWYINSEDSDNFATAKGRCYHQGPEWLWPTGFFLRALLKFDLIRRRKNGEGKKGKEESLFLISQRLRGCIEMIKTSPWAGLTELTNKGGVECADSCPTQAWSAGCILDLFDDAAREDV